MVSIPEIATTSNTKIAQYKKFREQIPQNIEIKFHDANKDNKLNPTEWIEYEQNGQRVVGYSPFGNKNAKDTPEKIAKRLGVSEAEIKKQVNGEINPNSFLRFVLPKKKAETTTPPQKTTPEAKTPAQSATTPSAKSKTPDTPNPVVPQPTFKDGQKIGKFEQKNYKIKRGDNLHDLSIKLNTTPEELMKLNGLTSDKLSEGQELKYYSNRERYAFNKDIPDSVYLAALKEKTEGVFKGKEEVILKAAKDNNVPVSTIYAIMTQETGHGTSNFVKNRNNPGGIRVKGSTTHRTFSSLDDGIKEMAKLLSSYHRRGLDTLAEIRPRYSEDSVNWVNNTTRFQNGFCEALTKAQAEEAAKKVKK